MAAKQEVEQTPDLAAAILALAQSMADDKSRTAEAMELLRANQPQREIKEGDPEYVARQQAEGWFDAFEVPVFQNAYEAQARGETKQTQYRAAHLKPGKYLKGRVTVEVGNSGVHIKYPTSGDNLMKNMALWRSFEDLINQIWDEMGPQAA